MRRALANDLERAGHAVVVPVAPRETGSTIDELQRNLAREATGADWSFVIAPEFDGILSRYAALLREAGGRVIASNDATLALTADKHATAERLLARGIAAPRGMAVEAGERAPPMFAYPAVLKPRYGAGSQDVRLIDGPTDERARRPSRLEPFHPGLAGSVAFLCGPRAIQSLPACEQFIRVDSGALQYHGGACPLATPFAARASRLARAAVESLEQPLGWIGVDLVLGEAADGSEDVVIEINPRLTTSYVGLRALARDNLADAMIWIAEGRQAEIRFTGGRVCFDCEGHARRPED